MRKWLRAALMMTFVSSAQATYNANLVGGVSAIMTYTDGTLLSVLSNQPTANGSCSPVFFELDPSAATNDAAFNRLDARLAQAYATGEQVNIGFDEAGNCGAYGYIRVYRIG